jgi:hypothetical protein
MAVPITPGVKPDDPVREHLPVKLFDANLRTLGWYNPNYAPSHDGQRFLLNGIIDRRRRDPIVLVQGWQVDK